MMRKLVFDHVILPVPGIRVAALLFCIFLFSCGTKKKPLPFFSSRSAESTGIDFVNRMRPDSRFNLLSYMYYYNGAGVGAGDFNNDGQVDLFFAANQGQNRLYLNKGALHFSDVTEEARIPRDSAWSTGVSVVDINNDGLLDIHVCRVGRYKILNGSNQLLVCKGIGKDGIPYYADEAEAYGLRFSGFSTQAAFLDYDEDGDLDMFLLNHAVNHDGNYAPRVNFVNTYDSLAGQKLFRNDRVVSKSGDSSIRFTEVTALSGINGSRIGYGLGVTVSDINLDGWPDIYVGNDFHENDYLYINQRNGTFRDELSERIKHTSQFSMGVDVADINNDAFPEIVSMDMLPYDPQMLRRSLAEDDYNIYQQKIRFGYRHQYARNNLQINCRNGTFTEAAQYAGINATDWSWAALWTDFDNDGSKDLFVSNGIPKRMNDIDYIGFVSNEEVQRKLAENGIGDKDMALIAKFPEIKLPNRFYRNRGAFLFDDISDSIENNLPRFSNGAVTADLDNDGDLDIVVNNIDDAALIYENNSERIPGNASVRISLQDFPSNRNALGARLLVFSGTQLRTYESTPVHGFLSSMQVPLLVGLRNTVVDSCYLVWPDNRYEQIQLSGKKEMTIRYRKNLPLFDYRSMTGFIPDSSAVWEDLTTSLGIHHVHQENEFNEFNREPLLHRMFSTEGPALAVADINHDGLEDFFIGASKGYHNALYLQRKDGRFIESFQSALLADSMWENVSAVWTDVNGDTHPDLVVASGGNEYYGSDEHLLPLLYLNDGKGNLSRKRDAFSGIDVTQSSVVAADFDGDGKTDLFISGRTLPWKYGILPRSYLLKNDGTGMFTDITYSYASALMQPGMVTHARGTDADADGDSDLLLCYDWGGIDFFINTGKGLIRKPVTSTRGWWNKVIPVDVDQDGDLDIVALNFGLNSRLKASEQQPVSLYYNDFDNNGTREQVLTYFVGGQEIPFATKQELERQMPFLKKKFLYAADFSKAGLNELFGADKIAGAVRYSVTDLASTLFLNTGNGHYEPRPLPVETQWSSMHDAVPTDFNKDGLPDLLLGGNFYDWNVEIGRSDGDYGGVLMNRGSGNFSYHQLGGLPLNEQIRSIHPIVINGRTLYIMARNNAPLQIINPVKPTQKKTG